MTKGLGLEGQGDLASRFRVGITGDSVQFTGLEHLLAKSP